MSNLGVAERWVRGEAGRSGNLFTDGTKVWSYGHEIAHYDGEALVVRDCRASLSTKAHVEAVRRAALAARNHYATEPCACSTVKTSVVALTPDGATCDAVEVVTTDRGRVVRRTRHPARN